MESSASLYGYARLFSGFPQYIPVSQIPLFSAQQISFLSFFLFRRRFLFFFFFLFLAFYFFSFTFDFSSTMISMFVLFAFLLRFLPKCHAFEALFAEMPLITKFAVLSPLNWAFASTDSSSLTISFEALIGYLPGPIFFLWPKSRLNLVKGIALFLFMTPAKIFFASFTFLFLMKLQISTDCLNDTGRDFPVVFDIRSGL